MFLKITDTSITQENSIKGVNTRSPKCLRSFPIKISGPINPENFMQIRPPVFPDVANKQSFPLQIEQEAYRPKKLRY